MMMSEASLILFSNSGSRSFNKAGSSPVVADVLAGEAPADDVRLEAEVCSAQGADVFVDGGPCEVPSKHWVAGGVDFAKCAGLESSLGEAETEVPDP